MKKDLNSRQKIWVYILAEPDLHPRTALWPALAPRESSGSLSVKWMSSYSPLSKVPEQEVWVPGHYVTRHHSVLSWYHMGQTYPWRESFSDLVWQATLNSCKLGTWQSQLAAWSSVITVLSLTQFAGGLYFIIPMLITIATIYETCPTDQGQSKVIDQCHLTSALRVPRR